MKSITRMALATMAMLAVAIAGSQMFGSAAVTAPEPVAAYDDTAIRDLHRAVMPRTWVRKDAAGMVITWREVTDTTVDPSGNGGLPTSFRVDRRLDSGTDYTEIGSLPNSSSHPAGKIKIRDKSALPGIAYRYRVVVNYEGGENTGEYILRDSKAKTIAFQAYDYKFEGAPTDDGITLSWRPAVWDAHDYRITRQNTGSTPIEIGIVAHDADARRLTLTDTTATASGTYRYFFFPRKADGTVGDLSISTDVFKP